MKRISLAILLILITLRSVYPQDGLTCTSAININTKGVHEVDNTNGDITYRYTAEQTGNMIVTTCGRTSDNTWIILNNNCTANFPYDALASSNNTCGLQSHISIQVNEGELYYFTFMDDFLNDPSSPYQFEIGFSNDIGYSNTNPITANVGHNSLLHPITNSTFFQFETNEGDNFTIQVHSVSDIDIYKNGTRIDFYYNVEDGDVPYEFNYNISASDVFLFEFWTYLGEAVEFDIVSQNTLSTNQNNHDPESFKLHPIPSSDILNVVSNNKIHRYHIYSILGQSVQKGKINNNKIDIRNLNPGFYFIELVPSKKSFIKI